MNTKYSQYKEADFLTDDYFVESVLFPTQETETFWQMLIEGSKIDENEFIAAYATVKQLHKSCPEVPADRIDAIWDRLSQTNKKHRFIARRNRWFRYAAVACGLVGVLSFMFVTLQLHFNSQRALPLADNREENIVFPKQATNQIQLISGKETINLDGTEANVEYNSQGQLIVNRQSIAIPRGTEKASEDVEYSQLRVPYGKRAFLKLSDGTSLWINSGSTIVYPTVFDAAKREITVEGEVFAEVSHENDRPFVINTGEIEIQVYGTSFNVSAYKDIDETTVVLVDGFVGVKAKDGEVTCMKPNQLFSRTSRGSSLRELNDVADYISWRDGRYIYHNEPIENILLQLSRYYNVTMILPASVSGITCSGKLELKEDLNRLLNGLSEITRMSFASKGDEYRIQFD